MLESMLEPISKVCKALLLVTLYMFSLSSAQASDASSILNGTKTIVINGQGSVSVEPDQIRFVIGIDARAPKASVAYKTVEKKVQQIMATLNDYDIPEADIQAMDLSINPVVDYQRQQEIIAHDAKRNIAVKLMDINQYGAIMESLGRLGVMRFEHVQLASSQHGALTLQALEAAYKNAENKAQVLAKASGRKVRGLLYIKEHSSRPAPVFKGRMAMMASSESAATTSKGSIGVESSITATFEIE